MLEAEDDLEGFGAAGRRRGLAAGAGHAARAWPLQPFDQRGMRLAGRGLLESDVDADEPSPAQLWPATGGARLFPGPGSPLLCIRCCSHNDATQHPAGWQGAASGTKASIVG